MPTPLQLRKSLDDRLETVPDVFFSAVDIAQRELFKGINRVISELDTVDGIITNSTRNQQLIQSLDGLINEILVAGSYYKGLTKYGSEILTQGALVSEWFSLTVPEYATKEAYQAILKRSASIAIDKFTSEAVNSIFNQPLKEILYQSITSGATRTQITDSISQFIEGNEQVEGKLLRYAKGIGRDAFSAADRQLTVFIADDLGMEWYLYAGGTVKDSRKFCIDRVGNYYHKKEIESWAGLTWQGKAPVNEGTIFILAGGYNCLHLILPVTIGQVPETVIERNLLNGNYKV